MSILNRNIGGEVILCCGGKGCPTLKKVEDRIKIKDDFGNAIDISVGEANLIAQALKQEENQTGSSSKES